MYTHLQNLNGSLPKIIVNLYMGVHCEMQCMKCVYI